MAAKERTKEHVAIVTGANHGIGAATAKRLAAAGAGVVVTYLRLHDEIDPGTPEAYRVARASTADDVVDAIRASGGAAIAVEADLADDAAPARLFDAAEAEFGRVDILVNNATGWVQDTFAAAAADRFGRTLNAVTAATFDQQFAVDARATALLIAQFARRHIAAGATWGRIIGLTSGGPLGFPEEVSYGAAKAARAHELHDVGGLRARAVRRHRERRAPTHYGHRLGDRRGPRRDRGLA
jgi:3-oxoacyl-[acyl-carrier protein] reductase